MLRTLQFAQRRAAKQNVFFFISQKIGFFKEIIPGEIMAKEANATLASREKS
jgi:hypothetical protein